MGGQVAGARAPERRILRGLVTVVAPAVGPPGGPLDADDEEVLEEELASGAAVGAGREEPPELVETERNSSARLRAAALSSSTQ